MLFNSLQFIIFLPVVVLAYYIVPDRFKSLWLLAASYFFYMCWNAAYLLLILFSTLVTFLCAISLERFGGSPGKRKLLLILSLVINLSILFFFKYFTFAAENLNSVFRHIGFSLNVPVFDVLLPVGISFYTFQALGYTIDVYRGEIAAERNFVQYALFVSFFPQLVAGPIERSGNLLHQLSVPHRADFSNILDGVYLIIWGFFLKLVLADRIAIFVDSIYGPGYAEFTGWYVALAAVLFSFQIYCDFAGYSTIAMGSAKLLGIDLMENFNAPYLSASTPEFWRRWHISLSTWFRDYLYIPLGGNRRGKLRKYLNLLITFAVSGLWHGANWGYVMWGLLNGIYQVIGGILTPIRKKLSSLLNLNVKSIGCRVVSTVFTFALISFAFIFFRASRLSPALVMVKNMFGESNPWIFFDGSLLRLGLDGADFLVLFVGLLVLFCADMMKYRGIKVRNILMREDAWFQAVIIALSVCAILVFGVWGTSYDAASFIYFQF